MLALIVVLVGTVDLAREHLGPAALAHIPVWSALVNALIVPPHVLPGPDQPARRPDVGARAVGIVFQRTRNLAAGTIIHMLIDTP